MQQPLKFKNGLFLGGINGDQNDSGGKTSDEKKIDEMEYSYNDEIDK